jgi:hypothetical protein
MTYYTKKEMLKMDSLKNVLKNEKVLNELKREIARWAYLVDSKVVFCEFLEKSNTFYITINSDCDIWIWTKDEMLQRKTAEAMKTILDFSEKMSFAEVIEQIEADEGEECREYREIAEALDEDIAPYGEA